MKSYPSASTLESTVSNFVDYKHPVTPDTSVTTPSPTPFDCRSEMSYPWCVRFHAPPRAFPLTITNKTVCLNNFTTLAQTPANRGAEPVTNCASKALRRLTCHMRRLYLLPDPTVDLAIIVKPLLTELYKELYSVLESYNCK